jgi:hypothetical protein
MNFKVCMSFLVVLVMGISSAYGAIGWAGDIWPCSGASYPDNADISVYVSAWKDGCTPGAGACPGLEAWLYYKKATEPTFNSVLMSYCCESGNNDRFVGVIPSAATESGVNENWYVDIYDATDGSWYSGATTEGGCGTQSPPFIFNITPATERDVTVTFRVDMACLDISWYSGLVYFTGDGPGWNWVPCDPSRQMSDPDGDLIFEGQFTFPAGSNPSVQYKYNDDNCNWEGTSNRFFTIDDSSPTQILPIDTWDNWDCSTPSGPAEITGPGSWCVTLGFCGEYLDIPLVTPFNPPIIPGIAFVPGCELGPTSCDMQCSAGRGTPEWNIVEVTPGVFVLRLCMPRSLDNFYGCFCMTIDQILPVELSTFEATALVEAVRLDWSTATEKDNSKFVIERSMNGTSWTEIAEVPGSGTTQTAKSYTYIDAHLMAGTSYSYRLSSVDINGERHSYDRVVSATPFGPEMVAEYNLTQNYPNPFNPTTSFEYTVKEAGVVTIKVFSITGREEATLVNESQSVGVYRVTFDGTNLPSGIYVYRMNVNGFSASHKMVLMK